MAKIAEPSYADILPKGLLLEKNREVTGTAPGCRIDGFYSKGLNFIFCWLDGVFLIKDIFLQFLTGFCFSV